MILRNDATEKEAKFEETNFVKQVVKIVRWESFAQPSPRVTLIYTEKQRQDLPRICADARGFKNPQR